jgi:hypothetical protein
MTITPVYEDYERMLSCAGKNANYGRIQAADIYSYVGGYNFINATIAPLRDTKFNRLKSELKVVEAGWMGKAIIASEPSPTRIFWSMATTGWSYPTARKTLGTRRSASL